MTGSPQLHLPALSLRKLEVAMAWVPSSVIEPLLDAAPHLTVLRLFPSTDNIHSLYTFVRLAPQLRHLGIISVGNSLTSELGAVVDFLRNFTSLTSLCLYGTAVEDLASFLRPLPNPLVLLETAQVVPVAGIYAHSSSFGYLTCILRDCKAVQRLQRWRLEWGEEPRNAEEQKQEWEAACSALGIELCDRRRRFTGERRSRRARCSLVTPPSPRLHRLTP